MPLNATILHAKEREADRRRNLDELCDRGSSKESNRKGKNFIFRSSLRIRGKFCKRRPCAFEAYWSDVHCALKRPVDIPDGDQRQR
jgi:hypothetical protein